MRLPFHWRAGKCILLVTASLAMACSSMPSTAQKTGEAGGRGPVASDERLDRISRRLDVAFILWASVVFALVAVVYKLRREIKQSSISIANASKAADQEVYAYRKRLTELGQTIANLENRVKLPRDDTESISGIRRDFDELKNLFQELIVHNEEMWNLVGSQAKLKEDMNQAVVQLDGAAARMKILMDRLNELIGPMKRWPAETVHSGGISPPAGPSTLVELPRVNLMERADSGERSESAKSSKGTEVSTALEALQRLEVLAHGLPNEVKEVVTRVGNSQVISVADLSIIGEFISDLYGEWNLASNHEGLETLRRTAWLWRMELFEPEIGHMSPIDAERRRLSEVSNDRIREAAKRKRDEMENDRVKITPGYTILYVMEPQLVEKSIDDQKGNKLLRKAIVVVADD